MNEVRVRGQDRAAGPVGETARLRQRVAELERALARRERDLAASRASVLPMDPAPPCGGCEAQRQLLHLVDALPVLAAYVDSEGRLSFVNALFERWYAAPRVTLLGQPLSRLFRDRNLAFQRQAQARALAGEAVCIESRMRFPDTVTRHVQVSWLPGPASAQALAPGCFLLLQDHSERRRAEQALTDANAQLDRRVRRATAELACSNRELRMEIASRQEAEADVRRSRSRFQDFAESSAGGLWETDHDLRFTSLIPLDETLAGAEAGIGKLPWELFGADPDHDADWREYRRVLNERIAFRDLRLHHVDARGQRRHWSVGGKPCYEDGRFIGYRGTATEVTAEVEAKHALERSEERYRIVTELTSDLVYSFNVDADGSMRADWFAGRLTSELKKPELGSVRRYGYWRSMVHPEDRQVLRERVARLAGGESSIDEFRVIALDGSVRWVRAYGKPERDGADGRVVRIIAAAQDITDQRSTEQALKASQEWLTEAIESMSDGFLLFDADARLVVCNSTVRRQFPAAASRMVEGAPFLDLLAASAQAGEIGEALGRVDDWLRERMQRHLAGEDSYELQTGDGRWIQATDRRTRAGGMVGLRTDITARKRAEEAMRRHERELAHALRRASMGEMASALAHELSQPLAAVVNYSRGSLRRLRGGGADLLEIGEVLERACHEAERAKSIVRHVGDFVRSGTPEVRAERLQEIVSAVCALLDAELRRAGVRLSVRLPKKPMRVLVNRIETEQVVLNLMRNGLDALREQDGPAPTLEVGARAARGRCEVWVRDSGPGIEPQVRERIFEPYVTTKPKGMGMGLSISRTLIESQGGKLWVCDRDAAGTTFRFTLPRVLATARSRGGIDG